MEAKIEPEDRINELKDIFEDRGVILMFYRLLDVSREQREACIKNHLLLFHPLQNKGFFSIGCTHCTQPVIVKEGRWNKGQKINVVYIYN